MAPLAILLLAISSLVVLIHLDSVNLDDLMLETNPDGSMDIGFRTDGEDAITDVDDLTHKTHIDNWESWSVIKAAV